MTILSLLLIQKVHNGQLMAKEYTLSTGKLPQGGLPRNSVVRITDSPDLTSAVYCGYKVTNQTDN